MGGKNIDHDDGEIDYSGLSLRELRDIEMKIDSRQYPKNFENLQSEITKLTTTAEDERLKIQESANDKCPEQVRREYSALVRKQAILSAFLVLIWAPEIIAGLLGYERFLGLGEIDWLIIKGVSLLPLFWFLVFVYECPSCGNAPGGGWTRRNCKSCGVQLRD